MLASPGPGYVDDPWLTANRAAPRQRDRGLPSPLHHQALPLPAKVRAMTSRPSMGLHMPLHHNEIAVLVASNDGSSKLWEALTFS